MSASHFVLLPITNSFGCGWKRFDVLKQYSNLFRRFIVMVSNQYTATVGEKALKNIVRPTRVYALNTGSERATSAPTASAPNRPGPPRLSLVVLPFANMGGGPEQEPFVDGVTESLTTDLSRIRGSFVIGPSTSFAYKGKAVDVKQIGRDLNVRYVLEGSVQRGGDRMRVNVQLVDPESGAYLWAERFDTANADPFDMQDEIVSRLAKSIERGVDGPEAAAPNMPPKSGLHGSLFSRSGLVPSWRDVEIYETKRLISPPSRALDLESRATSIRSRCWAISTLLRCRGRCSRDDRAGAFRRRRNLRCDQAQALRSPDLAFAHVSP